jgi:hypothetical protein
MVRSQLFASFSVSSLVFLPNNLCIFEISDTQEDKTQMKYGKQDLHEFCTSFYFSRVWALAPFLLYWYCIPGNKVIGFFSESPSYDSTPWSTNGHETHHLPCKISH